MWGRKWVDKLFSVGELVFWHKDSLDKYKIPPFVLKRGFIIHSVATSRIRIFFTDSGFPIMCLWIRADSCNDRHGNINRQIHEFDNDMVDGYVLKAFRSVKRKLKKGSNARRTLTIDEYLRLIDKAPHHLKACIITAYNTRDAHR